MTKFNNCSAEPVWDENDDLADMMDAVLIQNPPAAALGILHKAVFRRRT